MTVSLVISNSFSSQLHNGLAGEFAGAAKGRYNEHRCFLKGSNPGPLDISNKGIQLGVFDAAGTSCLLVIYIECVEGFQSDGPSKLFGRDVVRNRPHEPGKYMLGEQTLQVRRGRNT